MRSPILGEIVEIWETIPDSNGALEMHLVVCTSPREPNGEYFRAIHYPHGKLCCIPIDHINRILEGEAEGLARKEFTSKTEKEKRHGY
jgi:hypothetical protein